MLQRKTKQNPLKHRLSEEVKIRVRSLCTATKTQALKKCTINKQAASHLSIYTSCKQLDLSERAMQSSIEEASKA